MFFRSNYQGRKISKAKKIGVFLLILASAYSCSETKEILPETLGYDFYPLELGKYNTYQVEEIRFLVSGFDTSNYQLRETIFDSFPSLDQTTYLLKRETRRDESEIWRSDSIWTVTRTNSYLAIFENNIPFMKLTFPARVGREWDGNSLNRRGNITYYYKELESPLLDSLNVADHIQVVIEDIEENITGIDLRNEVYARGVGLVSKNYLVQERCTASDCGDQLGEVIAGRSLKQTIIESGYER